MSYAFFSEPVNNVSDVSVIRESPHRTVIRTVHPLSDKQVEDIYWCTIIMMKTGKGLKEILQENVKT